MINPLVVRQQVENLKLLHPEILEDDEAWLLSLESETKFDELLTQLVRRIEDTKTLAEGTGNRMDELKARKDRFLRRIESLRDLMFKLMESAELAKLELAECTLSIRNVAPSVIITDEAALPDDLCKFERKPDKAKIKEALSNPNCSVTGAMLSNGGKSLSMRVK